MRKTLRSILIAIGSVFSLGGNYYGIRKKRKGFSADYEAFVSDWDNIGNDIKKAMNEKREK